MSEAPAGHALKRLGYAKRHSLSLPVSTVFPQPFADVPREQLGTAANFIFVVGHLSGNQVLVRKSGDIDILTKMGFFGTKFQRNAFCESNKKRKRDDISGAPGDVESAKSGHEQCDKKEMTEDSDDDELGPLSRKRFRVDSSSSAEGMDVEEGSADETVTAGEEEEEEKEDEEEPGAEAVCDLRPPVPSDKVVTVEPLVLSCYEAFFLMHSVGMLRVYDSDDTNAQPMTLMELWNFFMSRYPLFPYHYSVYLFYRGKGWIPKNGLRVGAHFTLYPQGPSFFHAVYSVRIQLVRSDTMTPLLLSGNDTLTNMKDLMTVHRVANKVDKKLVLCYVIVPESLRSIASPSMIPRLKVMVSDDPEPSSTSNFPTGGICGAISP